jgi:putative SOS response-associated peptidase YedK
MDVRGSEAFHLLRVSPPLRGQYAAAHVRQEDPLAPGQRTRSRLSRSITRRGCDIQAADQEIYGFAGLWEETPTSGEPIFSCTIVTTQANELMASIHNSKKVGSKRVTLPIEERRMPVILRMEDRDAWLHGTKEEATAAIRQYPSELMVAHPVSQRVGNTRNNDPTLILPLDR